METLRLLLVASLSLSACAAPGSGDMDLSRSVSMYNDALRWKRFEQAAAFIPADARAAFLERYLATEDRLQIESLEVRSVVSIPEQDVPTFDVVVVASAYLLPSNVVERITLIERWQQRGGVWRMVHADHDLAPPQEPPRR
jgi:hypothetical protein